MARCVSSCSEPSNQSYSCARAHYSNAPISVVQRLCPTASKRAYGCRQGACAEKTEKRAVPISAAWHFEEMGAVGGGDARLEHAAGALDRSKASLMHPPEAPLNLWRNYHSRLNLEIRHRWHFHGRRGSFWCCLAKFWGELILQDRSCKSQNSPDERCSLLAASAVATDQVARLTALRPANSAAPGNRSHASARSTDPAASYSGTARTTLARECRLLSVARGARRRNGAGRCRTPDAD
jgi:hypothetical protein